MTTPPGAQERAVVLAWMEKWQEYADAQPWGPSDDPDYVIAEFIAQAVQAELGGLTAEIAEAIAATVERIGAGPKVHAEYAAILRAYAAALRARTAETGDTK